MELNKDEKHRDYDYIDRMLELSTEVKKVAATLQKRMRDLDILQDSCVRKLNEIESITSREYFSDEEAERLQNTAEEFYSNALIQLESMYLSMQKTELRETFFHFNPQYKDVLSENVWVCVENDKMYVRTPLINVQSNHHVIKRGAQYWQDYYKFYAPEIIRKTNEIFEKLLPFPQKNIHVLAVYNDNKIAKPDTINLDIKTTIDAVTYYTLGEDSAFSCTFSLASIITKSLPEGMYYTVQNGFGEFPDINENTVELSSVFKQEIEKIARKSNIKN